MHRISKLVSVALFVFLMTPAPSDAFHDFLPLPFAGDLSVSIDRDNPPPSFGCEQVVYRVTYRPGFLDIFFAMVEPVETRTSVFLDYESIYGPRTLMTASRTHRISRQGGSQLLSVIWDLPDDADFDPDHSCTVRVIVDPQDDVYESNEGNNQDSRSDTIPG